MLSTSTARPSSAVITSIGGTAGVGKTAVALHWAHRVRSRFVDGDLFVNLRGFDHASPVDPSEVLDSFLRAFGLAAEVIPLGIDERAALYRSVLHGRSVLIVLDNARCAEQVLPLLPASAGCFAIVTSRHTLSALRATHGTAALAVDILSEFEALDLLRGILKTERVNAEIESSRGIARLCGYLPLALRIVAERIRVRAGVSLGDIETEMKGSRDLLAEIATDDASLALETVFDWSYEALPQTAKTAFRRMALNAGPDVSLGAIAATTGGTEEEARVAVRLLCDLHLTTESEPRRFVLHDLLRLYAARRLDMDEADSGDGPANALLTWYVRRAVAADRVLMPQREAVPVPERFRPSTADDFSSYGDALAWCDAERVNLVLAINQAVNRDELEVVWLLAVSLRGFFNLRKHWSDWRATHERALAAARALDDAYAEGRVLNGLGTVLRQIGHADQAVAYHRSALQIREQLGDERGIGSALDGLAGALRDTGELMEAENLFLKSLQVGREIGDPHRQAWALHNLGETALLARNLDSASQLLLEALPLRREVADSWGEGRTLHVLGDVFSSIDAERASGYYDAALAVRQRIGDRWGTARTLDAFAALKLETGDLDTAIGAWSEAYAILDELGDAYAVTVRQRMVEMLRAPRIPRETSASTAIRSQSPCGPEAGIGYILVRLLPSGNPTTFAYVVGSARCCTIADLRPAASATAVSTSSRSLCGEFGGP